ncbi:hypothetical protein GN244_ATG15551 [Phytophthora infestans]|uniref:Uncharacterized protein n=1 Tax=Phytophthora infestans TaxID=4787 RepID=A0A833SJ54_PHYIN|nr:hypothetical protein GN244_ATG19652 [Phytophthora infestans]KAF4032619.1 hypothetical protein GN244_ATG15551 [Phytophthora infestans]KAF4142374.1 hypothetical protein GN958_ATG08550 [Phytophthora infestans]
MALLASEVAAANEAQTSATRHDAGISRPPQVGTWQALSVLVLACRLRENKRMMRAFFDVGVEQRAVLERVDAV